ncbi:aspartate/glutamate racemase family protein [Gryllotalpicola protaetiae]|uniref:Hydantoin racemase n=1 Tax=Gryllotalpicola protaetiae TaxID=2419771 RepID=A0A387BNW4_9MICO|nr:aspartate/glutamate racemase family protein [Gryllotalpicola protaetiae]
MHLRAINPNTTSSMTAAIGRAALAAASAGTTVTAVNPEMGPASIESHYDEALAVPGLLAEIARGEADAVDAYVLACFGDPGLDAAREVASGPVVGIAEAAMHLATLLGRHFSIVTTLPRTIGRAEELAERYGFWGACSGIHAVDIPVLDLELPGSDARRQTADECRRALRTDGSDVIVLGCAGMADFCAEVSAELGVPVIDGVAAATRLAESLVALGLSTSRRGEYARPPLKEYRGALAEFSLSPAAW